ncbi:MAG: hypothetical protein KDD37_04395 [Bdellovibrionales bacterium]|nr:hypothetical protein [Bdellovibrionales bacterium]
MAVVCIVDRDSKSMNEMVSFIKNSDMDAEVHSFASLEAFVAATHLFDSIAKAQKVVAKIDVLIFDYEACAKIEEDIKKIKRGLEIQGLQNEFPTRLLLTSFEGVKVPVFNLKVDDYVYKPLEKQLFLQKLQIAITAPEKVEAAYLALQPIKEKIEVGKKSTLAYFNDFCLTIKNPGPLHPGAFVRFYSKRFGHNQVQKIIGRSLESTKDGDGYLCRFDYFGLNHDKRTTLRKNYAEHKEDRVPLVVPNDKLSDKPQVVIVDIDTNETQSLKHFLEENVDVNILHFPSYARFLASCFPTEGKKVADTSELIVKPAKFKALTVSFELSEELELIKLSWEVDEEAAAIEIKKLEDEIAAKKKNEKVETPSPPPTPSPAPDPKVASDDDSDDDIVENAVTSEAKKPAPEPKAPPEKNPSSETPVTEIQFLSHNQKDWEAKKDLLIKSVDPGHLESLKDFLSVAWKTGGKHTDKFIFNHSDNAKSLLVLHIEKLKESFLVTVEDKTEEEKDYDYKNLGVGKINLTKIDLLIIDENYVLDPTLWLEGLTNKTQELKIKNMPRIIILGKANEPPVRFLRREFSDYMQKPSDKALLGKKLLTSYQLGLTEMKSLDVQIQNLDHTKLDESIMLATEIDMLSLSEFGIAVRFGSPIRQDMFIQFYLKSFLGMDNHEPIYARCYFSEEDTEVPGKYICYFTFLGVSDEIFKTIRLWMRDYYIKSKDAAE